VIRRVTLNSNQTKPKPNQNQRPPAIFGTSLFLPTVEGPAFTVDPSYLLEKIFLWSTTVDLTCLRYPVVILLLLQSIVPIPSFTATSNYKNSSVERWGLASLWHATAPEPYSVVLWRTEAKTSRIGESLSLRTLLKKKLHKK
jgi:hypothetical protein